MKDILFSITVQYCSVSYANGIEKILETLKTISEPECVALIMEFLLSLVKLKFNTIAQLYPMCVRTAILWVPIEHVCIKNVTLRKKRVCNWHQWKMLLRLQVGPKALALVRTIVIDSRRTKNSTEVLAELDLSVLTLVFGNNDDTDGNQEKLSTEMQDNFAELMQLLQEMAKTPATRTKVLQVLTDQRMRSLLRPMLECDNNSAGRDWQKSLFQVRHAFVTY